MFRRRTLLSGTLLCLLSNLVDCYEILKSCDQTRARQRMGHRTCGTVVVSYNKWKNNVIWGQSTTRIGIIPSSSLDIICTDRRSWLPVHSMRLT